MKQFTEKQLQTMDDQIAVLATKLEKLCKRYKITDRTDELMNENWDGWDEWETQEAIVNELQQIDIKLSNVSYYINQLANK